MVVFLAWDGAAGELVFVPETATREPALAALLDAAQAWIRDNGSLEDPYADLQDALRRTEGAVGGKELDL